jgi:diadenosine tetraphosphate (Ap4A) HIT family hydrolase
MSDPNNPCIFCKTNQNELIFENDLAYASSDSYPVSQFHSLVVPKRCIENYFELNENEILACNDLIKKLKKKIISEDKSVEGFNIGTNAGKVAGQSIFHCHIHVIPRRKGDVDNPQGGVRSVIPLKQHYIRKIKK